MAGTVRGTIGDIRRRWAEGKDGGGYRPQVIRMTAGHVSTKMKGITGDGREWMMAGMVDDGRVWVMTAGAE